MFSLFDLKSALYKIYPPKKKKDYFEITLRTCLKPTGAKELKLGFHSSALSCKAEPNTTQGRCGEAQLRGAPSLGLQHSRLGAIPQRREGDRGAPALLLSLQMLPRTPGALIDWLVFRALWPKHVLRKAD